jgi:carbamoyl-phosphate synthase large subunit
MTPDGRSRIVVTGVGGAPGFDLAVGLLRRGIDVIGLDADPLAPGLLIPASSRGRLAPLTARVPGGTAGRVRGAATGRLVLDGRARVARADPHAARPGRGRVRTWLPDLDGARACLDKAAFCAALVRHGLPVPRTWLPHEIAQVPDGAPLVVKPRHGQGSKGVYFCSERRQAAVLSALRTSSTSLVHGTGTRWA